MLKGIIEKCKGNIPREFSRTKIISLDHSLVWNQLPNNGVDANHIALGNVRDESVLGLLREHCYGKEKLTPKNYRKDKLKVEIGRCSQC